KLLLQGFPLAEGRELLDKWGPETLADQQPELPAFISASDRRDRRARLAKQAIGWSVAGVLAVMSWQLRDRWIAADRARLEGQAALWVANARTALRDNQVMPAIESAAKAFAALPRENSRSALGAAMLELSPHLQTTFQIGPRAGEA